ncbi:RcpC/CpaB family pilus assembly protein [Glutamicibacter sp. NPDC087344]|uniref:RcpC/CpaB family pilus assembly protein n=1 Tax=Glutamicibacter sp. NPDC087344 TaxID=3363994 RepID=UPI0038186C49
MKLPASRRAPLIPRPKVRPVRTRNEALRRYRRPLAIACLLLALAASLNTLSAGQLAKREVVVAASEIAAGAIISPADVQLRSVLADPDDPGLLSDPQALVGQRLAVGVPAGTALRHFLLVGPQLLTGSAAGTVAVPIRLSDPATVGLLHPGQLVDIVLTTGDGFEQAIRSETIARAVAVLWVPSAERGQFGMLAGGTASGEGIVVVAAAASLSDDLAGAVSRGKVSAVLVN